MPRRKKHKKPPSGFTIVELAMALTVIAIALASYLALSSGRSQYRQYRDIDQRVSEINDALTKYVVNGNGFLPCPAPGTALQGGATFGVASCAGADTNGVALVGTVPFITLGLDPSRYYFDSYGNPFTYAVDSHFTTSGGFSSTADGSIPVVRPDNSIVYTAVFVVLSHGRNGYGAYIPGGGKIYNAQVTDMPEQCNANCSGGYGLSCNGANPSCNGEYFKTFYDVYNAQGAADDVVYFNTKEGILSCSLTGVACLINSQCCSNTCNAGTCN